MTEKSIYDTDRDPLVKSVKKKLEKDRLYGIRQQEKVGAPYYQPEKTDSPAERRIRSRAQREYIDASGSGMPADMDEGALAPAARAVKNFMAGKRGSDVMKDIEGDAGLMRGAKTAGEKAVGEFRNNPTDSPYAKGGMTASKRADGIAQRGKTRGRMV